MLKLNNRDVVSISLDFFELLEVKENHLTIKSKFTPHIWKLEYSDCHILLYHAHHIKDKLHYQTECMDVYNTMLYILEHEDYQLNNRQTERYFISEQLLFFYSLIKEFGLQ